MKKQYILMGATMVFAALFWDCIYNHRTTKTNQKYPSVNL